MIEYLAGAALFVGTLVGWAWWTERRNRRRREAMRSWYHENVPPNEIPWPLR